MVCWYAEYSMKGGRCFTAPWGCETKTPHYRMKQKRREPLSYARPLQVKTIPSLCDCLLLAQPVSLQSEEELYNETLVPLPQALYTRLHAHLSPVLPAITPYSILLLHVSQLSHEPSAKQSVRQHSMTGFLEQLLVNIRRVIRADDELLALPDVGAAVLFPAIDQHCLASILERIYQSVTLLQAETVIPPLQHETVVQFGVGTSYSVETTVEQLLTATCCTARVFTLRPMLSPTPLHEYSPSRQEFSAQRDDEAASDQQPLPRVPFMRLPTKLPVRLRHLIAHSIAQELRCAPVGRNNHCLTVAMANPANTYQLHYLTTITGMTIFPVSCVDEELDLLLDQGW